MWNKGFFLLWSSIARIYYEDLECGLQLVNKLTSDNLNLASYFVMRTNLSVQVLNKKVSNVLNNFGPEEEAGAGKFRFMIDKLFNWSMLGILRNISTIQKPFLKPYKSIDDIRFAWFD